MSKTSKSSLPTSYNTTLSVNGNNKASVKMNSGSTKLNYNLNPYEQQAYDFSQKSYAENLPNVNVFSPETIANLNKQVEAFRNKGIKSINDIYNPILKNMQNDIASRFGNLNNSVFMDNLNKIESNRSEAISGLAQDVTAREQELVNNELANRYNYLNFLSGYQGQIMNDLYNTLGLTNNAQNASLNYLSKAMSTNNLASGLGSNSTGNLLNNIVGMMMLR